MIVLRLVGILTLISAGTAIILYLATRNRRYLTIAWRIFQFAVIFLLIFAGLYLIERLVLVF